MNDNLHDDQNTFLNSFLGYSVSIVLFQVCKNM